jgi:subtilisin family serine protease
MTDSTETARYLVLLDDNAVITGARELHRIAGLRTASTADAGGASAAELFSSADGIVLHGLGIAMVNAGADQVAALGEAVVAPGPIAALERERTVYAIAEAPLLETSDEGAAGTFTWGLEATGASRSTATGAGTRVAVLDTGFDVKHPDFAGRDVVTSSFVPGESIQDGHGHGTHVIGTSCGPRAPKSGTGFGIAERASIYAGKVLSNEGSGSDGGILAGIDWAITNGCAVVSMSLGAPTQPGEAYSQAFERVAQRAMAQGTLIIAAAGNESQRASGVIAPVGHPANCPSIMAVGAIDPRGAIADFSSGTVDRVGQVDIVGPGVKVYSSWPGGQHKELSGTSMATPHVSGVAALLSERHQVRAWQLWARLSQSARRMPLPSTDVGSGLVQAP